MGLSNLSSGFRYCPNCQTDQPLTNYTIRKNGKVVAWCRPCSAKKSANYRANNRERYLQLKRQHRRIFRETKSTLAIRKNWDNLSVDSQNAYGCGIYCVTIGPKFYIGSAVVFRRRMREHTRKLGAGRHINKFMQAAFDKYQTFDAEIIECCAPNELSDLEQKYIDLWFGHDDCMNLRPDVATLLGFRHSDETKKLLSEKTKQHFERLSSGNK